MDENKRVYRNVRRSKQAIQTALVGLLANKDLNKIKIKELIEAADLSKGTFYSHYSCLEDVLEEIETEQLALMFQTFEDSSPALVLENFFPLFLSGLQIMEQNRELFRILFSSHSKDSFSHRVTRRFLDYLLSCTTGTVYFDSPQQAREYLTYVAGGSIAVIQSWLEQSSDLSAEALAKLLNDCALRGIQSLRERTSL